MTSKCHTFFKKNADYLINALEHKYKTKTDLKGDTYIEIDFQWYYVKGKFILTITGYVD